MRCYWQKFIFQILLSLQTDQVDLFHKQKHSKGFLKYFHFDKSRSITSSQTEYMSGAGALIRWMDWAEVNRKRNESMTVTEIKVSYRTPTQCKIKQLLLDYWYDCTDFWFGDIIFVKALFIPSCIKLLNTATKKSEWVHIYVVWEGHNVLYRIATMYRNHT